MRIVQVSPYSWDVPGGVQAHVRQLASRLESRGHEVHILAPGREPLIRRKVHIVGRGVPVRTNGSVARICFSPQSAHLVGQALREIDPDVIHVHEPLAPSTSMFAVLRSSVPVVATFHANVPERPFREPFYRVGIPIVRPVWNRIDVRLAVSEAARASVSARMGHADFEILPNGADVEAFATAAPAVFPPGRHLLFVGRLEPRKGFPVAIDAFARVAARHPALHLWVVGDGAARDAVEILAPAVRARVHMLGRVLDAELPSYFRAADVFLAPSTGGESFGIVLVEAMAAGLPIVASDIEGYRDVARDGREALLVPPEDASALADGIERLLRDPALAMALGSRGAVRAHDFDWSHIVDRLEAIYQGLRIPGRLPRGGARAGRSVKAESAEGR